MPLVRCPNEKIDWTVVGDWGELTLELNPEEARKLVDELNKALESD